MAYTYATLTEDVIANMEEDSQEFLDALPSIVARAQNYLQRRVDAARLNVIVTASLSTANRVLALPNDLLVLKSVQVSTSTGWSPLLLQTNEYLAEYWPVFTSVATPKYYANADNVQILLAPTPSQNFTTLLEYVARPAVLTSASTTANWFSTNAENALFNSAMMFANLWTKNGEAYTKWKAMTDEEIVALNNEAKRSRNEDSADRRGGTQENNMTGA